ncbi:sigma-70 family RNA polymerase sigma factor [Pseudonocardiaceae bacterium YIM PH 21723]|nr:sigma-70 family RNA polymerase sigma factor [Pseudonocardiaceae bacterium YIM PH 21723]
MRVEEWKPSPTVSNFFWEECIRIRPYLIRIATRYCAAPAQAEDIVHDALLRAAEFTNLDITRLRPFLVTVVKRLCADDARRRMVATRLGTHTKLHPGVVEDPADTACDRAEARWLASRLGLLSQRERSLVLMVANGLGHGEIAKELNTTPRAAQSALCRIRRRIRVGWLDQRIPGQRQRSVPVAAMQGAAQ